MSGAADESNLRSLATDDDADDTDDANDAAAVFLSYRQLVFKVLIADDDAMELDEDRNTGAADASAELSRSSTWHLHT
jgi:hypothetical protein